MGFLLNYLKMSSNNTIEIVINCCYGLFSLSNEGYRRYHELLKQAGRFDEMLNLDPEYDDQLDLEMDLLNIESNYQLRRDPLLIQAIKEIGIGKACGPRGACLQIVSIKKGTKYIIEEHDGWEIIRTIDSFAWTTA